MDADLAQFIDAVALEQVLVAALPVVAHDADSLTARRASCSVRTQVLRSPLSSSHVLRNGACSMGAMLSIRYLAKTNRSPRVRAAFLYACLRLRTICP